MKKILFFVAMITLLLLTACGGKDELQAQVDDLNVQVDSLTTEVTDLTDEVADTQSELTLAESAVSLCVMSLEEEVTATSGLRGSLSDALDSLAESEKDLEACTEEVISLSLGPEMGGGGEEADIDECAGTERILMMSTPVLQQAVDKDGDPKYNKNDKMIIVAVPNSRVEDFVTGDVVCVTEHYAVAGGWAVFLISGTREASFNIFIPAHYLEPLPEEDSPFTPANCDPSYPDFCIPPPPPDLNCGDTSYGIELWNFTVDGSDPHGFDSNDDGIGCNK